jgi:hypothetical protein
VPLHNASADVHAPGENERRTETRTGEMTELSDSARDVVGSFDALQDTADKKAVLNELQTANPELVPTGKKDKVDLWRMLFVRQGFWSHR